MDGELKSQAENAWAKLQLAKVGAPPTTLSGFLKAMHPGKAQTEHRLRKLMLAFPTGTNDDLMWAAPRGDITGHRIAKAAVQLLTLMCAMGKNEFIREVFEPKKGFDARLVTCLFMCGLIEHEHMSFQNSDLDSAEVAISDTGGGGTVDLEEAERLISDARFDSLVPRIAAEPYTTSLMRLLLSPKAPIDLHTLQAGDAAALPRGTDTVPATLFVADGAPTSDDVCILDALESTTWSDYLVNRHTITGKAELWYVFFMWLCRGTDPAVGSYGVKIGDYSCIFVYNLPQWSAKPTGSVVPDSERQSAFKEYIEKPCGAYTAIMQILAIEPADVVSKLQTTNFNFVGLLYVHLLVMARVAARDPSRRFFTQPRVAELDLVQGALCMTGDMYSSIAVTLRAQYMRDATTFPFLYPEADRKTQAIDRLAVAHMDLLTNSGIDSIVGGIVNTSTCPVRYAWVFEYGELLRGPTFKQAFRAGVDAEVAGSPRMAVYDRIHGLIKGHLTDDEKEYYDGKFSEIGSVPSTASSESTAPSRAGSAGRVVSGREEFSDRESGSDASSSTEVLYGRAGAGTIARGGVGGDDRFNALVELIARVEEHTRIESAVLGDHVEALKNHTAISGFSIADAERLIAVLQSKLGEGNASLLAGLAEIRTLSDDIAAQHTTAEAEQAAARSAHELEVAGLKVQLDEAAAKLEACTLRADTLQGEKEELERQLTELQSKLAALEAEKLELTAQLDAHTASKADLLGATATEKEALEARLAEQEEAIRRLNLRVAELEGELTALKLRLAEAEAALAAMTAAKEALERDLEREKEEHLKKILALEQQAAATAAAHKTACERYERSNKRMRLDNERQETENGERMTYLTRKLEGYLKHAQASFGADMKTVHDTTTAATNKQKGLGLLTDLLEKRQFADFYAGVAPAGADKVRYTLPALFLICESIAGTWKMQKEGGSETVTEKLAYDCRVYDSIDEGELDGPSIKTYISPLFQEFVSEFRGAKQRPGAA